MSNKIKIKLIKNGPALVSGFEFITYCGEKSETEEQTALCRCGETKNAPFCDGEHTKIGFSDTNEIEKQKAILAWEGNTIRTYFNSNICMHASTCKPLKVLREKELNGDISAAKKIAEVVTACPSGALSFETKDGLIDTIFESSGEIEIVNGGEIRINCTIESEDLKLQERQIENRITLCRCGLSKNKPYCDASHNKKKNFI